MSLLVVELMVPQTLQVKTRGVARDPWLLPSGLLGHLRGVVKVEDEVAWLAVLRRLKTGPALLVGAVLAGVFPAAFSVSWEQKSSERSLGSMHPS